MSCTNKKKILEIEELSVSFLQYKGKTSRQSWLPVISGLSVAVREGELVAVVGSSGSGKSLLAHAILGILPYNANVSGTMKFQGCTSEHLISRSAYESGETGLGKKREKRGRKAIGIVPQVWSA